jgi:ribosomal protein L7/L12
MIELLDLQQTLHAFAACNDDHAVYQSFGWVHATNGDLLQARFWLPPDEETAFDDDSEVPADARALGLSTYLEPATFADVLEVQKRQRPLSTLAEYAQALVHYHEYDAFQEVEGIDEALGEATAADRAAARDAGVGAGIFASFDLQLLACAEDQLKAIAQRAAHLHEVPVGEALARCRALPLLLGQALDRNRAQAIKDEFEAIGATVQVQGFKAFAWMDAPTLR